MVREYDHSISLTSALHMFEEDDEYASLYPRPATKEDGVTRKIISKPMRREEEGFSFATLCIILFFIFNIFWFIFNCVNSMDQTASVSNSLSTVKSFLRLIENDKIRNVREYMPSSPTSSGASASEPRIQDSWPRNQDDNSSKILDFSGYQYVPETFEIVINFCSGKRAGMLKKLLKKYMLCNGVGIIHILNNCNMTMEWLRTGELYKGRIHIVEGPNVGPLSHRFWNHNWTKTHMWHQDDDMFYDCEEMTQAYRKILPRWNEMAGYSPHLQQCFSRTLKDLEFKNKILDHGDYDCIYLTKGGFIPTPVLDLYWNPRWDAIRAKVDELLTGEDLLFCAVITYEKLVQNMVLEWSALAMLQYDQSVLSKGKRVRRTRDELPDQSRRLGDFTASLSMRSSGKRYIVYDMIREQMKRDLAGVDFSQMQQNKWRCVLSDFEISTISKCCPENGNKACYRI